MKILLITHNYPLNDKDRQNAGIFVYDFASEFKKKAEVVVFCPGNEDKSGIVSGIRVCWFKWFGGKELGGFQFWNPVDIVRYIASFLNGFRQIEKLKKENPDFDFVLAMWAFPAGLFALWLKIRFKIPYATWSLGSDIYVYGKIPIIRQLIKVILRQAKSRFADGIDLKDQVERLSVKSCVFLPSSSKFQEKEAKKKFSIKKGKKVTLSFLGRMESVKGPDIFLSALIKVKEKLTDFHIHFLGDGSLLDKLKEEAKKADIIEHMTFWGNVNDPDQIATILRASDWLVIPSRSDSIPLVFSEAMRVGTPVIASDLPDLKYLINKYKVGITFKTGNEDELVTILENISIKENSTIDYCINIRRVVKMFSLEESVDRILREGLN